MTTSGPDNQARDHVGSERGGLIFCGMCGALNPATNGYCAACGSTMLDAFHATEGLRVYERPDTASRLITVVPGGDELDVVEDADAPTDYVRVRLDYGRLGYIRLQDVADLAETSQLSVRTPAGRPAPDINTHATGCISSTAALGSLALVIVLGLLLLFIASRANTYDQGTLGIVFCAVIAPLLLATVAFYLYAKSREDRLADEDDEARFAREEATRQAQSEEEGR